MKAAVSEPCAPVEAPVDFAACEKFPDWRDRVAWPVSHAETFAQDRQIYRAFLTWLNDEADPQRLDIGLLAGGAVLAHVLAFAHRTLVVERAPLSNLSLVGDAAEIAYLRGEGPASNPLPIDLRFGPPSIATPSNLYLRRMARIASWSGPVRVFSTLLSPQSVAISHNGLLKDCARNGSERVGFVHAESIYAEMQRLGTGGKTSLRGAELAEGLCDLLVEAAGVTPLKQDRLRTLIGSVVGPYIARAVRDLEGARKYRRLPDKLWAGSGGYWPARCISIEALRRGHEVRRFEHGAPGGLLEVNEPLALNELSVTSEFTCATKSLAESLTASDCLKWVSGFRRPKLTGWRGDSHIASQNLERNGGPSSRRRVLYGPSILLGPRQLLPPILPDPIHLDWQFRLVESLKEMPVDLLCRPHPEGLLFDRTHPLAEITPLQSKNYEALLPEADVIIFDWAQSSTFPVALCTDRPIVFIDFGNPLFTPAARAAIERRCRIVHASFDERNRPHIDLHELTEAICAGPSTADPSEFREMFLGSP